MIHIYRFSCYSSRYMRAKFPAKIWLCFLGHDPGIIPLERQDARVTEGLKAWRGFEIFGDDTRKGSVELPE
jgi:hypothetical protein